MRISTLTMFESSLSSMNRQQGAFMEVGKQMASGRRVVSPSDDPQAASRAVGVSQSLAVTQQYADSRVSARNAMSQEESVLNSVSDALTSAKTLMVQAGNETLSDADRSSMRSQLQGIYEALIGQANTTDGNGSYLFGGIKDNAPPFRKNAGDEVEYHGADTVRHQQVDASRQMKIGNSGREVFFGVHHGADYVAEATTDDSSSLSFSGPVVEDTSAAGYGETFSVVFSGTPNNWQYSVEDGSGNAVSGMSNIAYDPESGASIQLNGVSLELDGDPASGDTIEVSKGQDQNIFSSLENAMKALDTSTETAAGKAHLDNALSTVSRQLDNSLDNVLTTRASVGARLNELDVLDKVGGNRSVNYEAEMSDLVDLDYAKAVSDYTLRQVGLQASQKAFVDMRGMSLFQML
ncbi:MAG: flagellar hook-associated protein 3 FlgL [Halomonadaceae bacterium T82-2]|nr:MAG: flagellar hook-associated protein 3 FlgL [Halomonadaceae bacterium T82-2]